MDIKKKEIIEKAICFVKENLGEDSAGHDWYHTERVWKMGRYLAPQEGGDDYIIQLGTLLHDIDDYKVKADKPSKLRTWLWQNDVDSGVIQTICCIIDYMSYHSENCNHSIRKTLEFQIIQDADRLDSLGAVGISRVFAYGGKKGRPIHDPSIPPNNDMDMKTYQSYLGTSINHFYEKLLKLEKLMNTELAQQIAKARTEYMRLFLDEFDREWKLTDFV